LLALSPAEAAVKVFGMKDWLAEAAERSLTAVYEHMPPSGSDESKASLLRVVTNRLLTGYAVEDLRVENDEVFVYLRRQSEAPEWSVTLNAPNLTAPVDAWFRADTEGLSKELADLMSGVPLESLAWGDAELKRVADEACSACLPGWRVSLMVRIVGENSMALETSFTPEQPLVLAVTPRISSTSIPAMLHSGLRYDLTKGYAPVIGLPVAWLVRHEDDFAAMNKEILKDEYLVDRAKATPEIEVKTGSVSEVDIELESARYAAWVWMAVYAGAEDKYPEVGLHFGRRASLLPGWTSELYLELITELDDFGLETRLGMRWSPWRNLWFGGEWSSKDDDWWLRASFAPRHKNPYAWARVNLEGETNAALGLRINDFFSVEIHYDSRDDDPWNLRAIVNL